MSEDIKDKQTEYAENTQNSAIYDKNAVKTWYPVAIYIGGAEHSVLHLLYVRFVAMVLHDLNSGLKLTHEEPFPRFFAHGLIVKDGAKMSKSRGNVVVPDKYIEKFGADTVRLYLMFLGQFSDGGDFRDSGIEGMNRFVRRVWKLFTTKDASEDSPETLRMINKTIKEVTRDVEDFSYNTAIAKLMEFYNFIIDDRPWSQDTKVSYLKLFAPFAPHFTEELFEKLGLGQETIHKSAWPTHDEKYLIQESVIIPIQINGKRRGEVTVESSKIDSKEEVEQIARKKIEQALKDLNVKNVIYVPGKIINFVV